MYDKPKVTIDLDEYLELKSKSNDNTKEKMLLEIGQQIMLKTKTFPMPTGYKITNRIVEKDIVSYTLSNSYDILELEVINK